MTASARSSTKPAAKSATSTAAMRRQLQQLQAAHDIRRAMAHYMALCDRLDAQTPLDELVGLFTHDTVWRGKGTRYAKTFGEVRGREALKAMFASYTGVPPHFALNVHFLCSEDIQVHDDATTATGHWVMLQTSTYADGRSHLASARLTTQWRYDADEHDDTAAWRMAVFETESLFSRPVDHWQAEAAMPVPARSAD